MRLKTRSARLILVGIFSFLAFWVPLLLLYVSLTTGGIDLKNSLDTFPTLKTLERILYSSDTPAKQFRDSLPRSIIYAFVVALVASGLSLLYVTYLSQGSRRKEAGLSFTLLSLTLLPQTYLVLSVLIAIQAVGWPFASGSLISFVLLIAVLPLSCWAFSLIASERVRKTILNVSLDGLTGLSFSRVFVKEMSRELSLVFVFAFAVAWGNFVIPFALGTQDSYPAVVQVGVFTSNLGRDWAAISAASTLALVPILGVAFVLATRFRRDET